MIIITIIIMALVDRKHISLGLRNIEIEWIERSGQLNVI